jgi:hypothetical protein
VVSESDDLDFHGYEIIRTQFFSCASIIGVSFSPHGIRFSSGCVRRFNNYENIEMLINPTSRYITIRPCSKDYKNKMRWASINPIGIRPCLISAKAFLKIIYEIFSWDTDKRYRLRGEVRQIKDETVAFFDTETPEMFFSRYDMVMPWATGFGEDYYTYRESQLQEKFHIDTISEYNSEPDLQPMSFKKAKKEISLLTEFMQKDEVFLNDFTDIIH